MRSLALWKTSFRYLFRSYVYLSLSVLGIAIGVAVVVAVDLSGTTVSRQLRLSNQAVQGLSTHQIVSGPDGVSELLYAEMRRSGSLKLEIAPIIERLAKIENSDYIVTVIGVDPFAELSFRPFIGNGGGEHRNTLIELLSVPNSALVAKSFAGLTRQPMIGDTVAIDVSGTFKELHLVGIIDPDWVPEQAGLQSLVVTDISTAQELFDDIGMLTRIDLKLPSNAASREDIAAIQDNLPPEAWILPTSLRTDMVREVTRAFDLNLSALSFLSLMVGVFLIYNTMSFSVVRRRTTIGLLRSIGVTRLQIMALFIGEACILASVSCTVGLLIGVGLANILLDITTRTLSDIFIASNAYTITIDFMILLKGVIIGVLATLAAAIIPTFQATSGSSTATTRVSSAEVAFRGNLRRISALGIMIAGLGCGLLYAPFESVFMSLCSLAFVTVGMTLQVPGSISVISKTFTWILRRRVSVIIFIGLRSLEASLSRTAIAVCALSLAVAVTIGIGLMVNSFRTTVDEWLVTSLDADIYVSPPSINSATLNGYLDAELLDILETQEGIWQITKLYTTELGTQTGHIDVAVVDAPTDILKASLVLKSSVEDVWDRFAAPDAVLVSEAYSLHNDVSVGDTIELPTSSGPISFQIVGIYRDYSSTRGVLMFHHENYDLHWEGRRTSSVAIYLDDDIDPALMMTRLYELSQPYQQLQIRDSGEIYTGSLAIFDRTFELTSVLRSITVIVACIGILSALVAHQIETVREGMIFRAIGLTPRQFRIFIGMQGVWMGVYSGLLAVPLGLVISWFLINVINRRSFGWEMTLQMDWLIIGQGFAIAVGAATVASLYPAFRRQAGKVVTEMSRDL